jgi:hypothetical protein
MISEAANPENTPFIPKVVYFKDRITIFKTIRKLYTLTSTYLSPYGTSH